MRAIAIDGPAGAGKSTISRLVAEELGYIYVDTGALYRAIGLFAQRNGVPTDDAGAVVPLLPKMEIELCYIGGRQRILLNGEDVSEAIRSPEMSMAASNVSAIPEVRAFLLDLQRQMAGRYNVVMDGRDIGTVVLPGADLKIFLTASVESRAQRRYEEYLAKGEPVDYNDILRDMKQRDYNDSHRAVAPLRRAGDAILLETSGNTLEKSVALVKRTIKEHLPQ